MEASLTEVLRSQTFQFLVGPDQTAFNLHSCLATKLSPVFAALINGRMAESIAHRAILENVDEGTFVRFCEYAYTGDYSIPPPTIVPEPSSEPKLDFREHEDKANVDGGGNKSEKGHSEETLTPCRKGNRDSSRPKWSIYHPLSWLKVRSKNGAGVDPYNTIPQIHVGNAVLDLPDRSSKLGIAWTNFQCSKSIWNGKFFQPYRNYQPFECFEETFLFQARLYVFGDCYLIEALRTLVLYKMRRTLVAFRLFPERVPDIFLLVQYVYQNTREGDGLRDLLTDFAVCMITLLLGHPDWDFFMREQGSFISELLGKLRKVSAL